MIFNRATNESYEDHQHGAKALNFLYNTVIGRLILKILINPIISKIIGFYHDTFMSKFKIKSFITKNNIDMSSYEEKEYKTFNEFFTRKRTNINTKTKKGDFISPADSKLLVYKITSDLHLKIKNSDYNLTELVDDKINLDDYKNGYCLVFRLALDDYHHYCFPDSGKIIESHKIKGKLHTVSSISKEYKIYKENHRVVTKLNTDNFNDIIYIEVGALSVGKIINHDIKNFKVMEEKGYFKMGGSTIVVLTKDKVLKIDDDILKYTKKDIEVQIKYGEKIGTKY